MQYQEHALKVHIEALYQNGRFNRKVAYSLVCIASALSRTNNSRRANKALILTHRPILMKIISTAHGCSQEQLYSIVSIINLIGPDLQISKEEQATILQVVGQIDASRGEMSKQLVEEILNFCSHLQELNDLNLTKYKNGSNLSSQEITAIMDPSRNQQWQNASLPVLLNLADNYKNDIPIFRRILDLVQWRVANGPPEEEQIESLPESIEDPIKQIETQKKYQKEDDNNYQSIKKMQEAYASQKAYFSNKKIVNQQVAHEEPIKIDEISAPISQKAYFSNTINIVVKQQISLYGSIKKTINNKSGTIQEQAPPIQEQMQDHIQIDITKDLQQPIVAQIEKKQQEPYSKERVQNLQLAENIKSEEFSIQSLKNHCKFIAFVSDLEDLGQKQYNQVLVSLTSITQTVLSHSFYVKKVADSETISKLIFLHKNLVKSGKKQWSKEIILRKLKLIAAMADKKQKKLQLFGDQESIQFFKAVVKKSLNGDYNREEISILLQILYICRANTDVYFKLGLFSMIIEMVNRNLATDLIIDYLTRIDLSSLLINQIYQRNLFNKLMTIVQKQPSNQQQRIQLNHWIKLAGKVCINHSIQQKFRSKELHIRVWQHYKNSSIISQKLNACYFFSYICIKNEVVCEWMIQNKVIEDLLSTLKNQETNDELYLLLYHICFNNIPARDYCFRLKYHLHLIQRLNQYALQGQTLGTITKYFYKSLGQMMSSKLHAPVFFKEQTVKKLIDIYNVKVEPAIFECLLDFISILQLQSQFDELKRQNFWDSLKIFQYKMSSEASYSYLLQIFLIMIKKGRTRQFNQPEVRSKACLKAQYSINMDGKQLALRFIIALSMNKKQNYMTQRCVRLLSSIMGLKISQNQLQLASEMIKIQGTSKNVQFLGLFGAYNIDTLIIDSFSTLSKQNVLLAISIMTIFVKNGSNSKRVCGKMIETIKKGLEIRQDNYSFKQIVCLLTNLSQIRQNNSILLQAQIPKNVTSLPFLKEIKKNSLQTEYNILVNNLRKNGLIKEEQLNPLKINAQIQNIPLHFELINPNYNSVTSTTKSNADLQEADSTLRQGKTVKMYKTDGSVSQLILFVSNDGLELNCGLKISQVVKQKWRLPLNEIHKTVTYQGQQSNDFIASVFQKNSGFFTKAPNFDCCLSLFGRNNEFHICFASKIQREQWTKYFQILRQNSARLLSKLK